MFYVALGSFREFQEVFQCWISPDVFGDKR